jgi:hypothetical protein
MCRTPAGHPEGYIEAFANLYRSFVAQVRAHGSGGELATESAAPIAAAVRGMSFMDAMVRSGTGGHCWVALES